MGSSCLHPTKEKKLISNLRGGLLNKLLDKSSNRSNLEMLLFMFVFAHRQRLWKTSFIFDRTRFQAPKYMSRGKVSLRFSLG